MASKGFVRVRPAHSDSLVKQYRRLLGERKFWADRSHHPKAVLELARLNAAIDALAKALPLVVPCVVVAKLKVLPFHLAVPLPGHALTRAVLAGLRKLGSTTEVELAKYIAATTGIDLELYDIESLRQRIRRTLDRLGARIEFLVAPSSPQ